MKVNRTTDRKYVVEAVDSALDLLEAFRDSEELSLPAICQRAKLNKSRIFRLLHPLAQRGYVERAADGLRYRLGFKLFEQATHFRLAETVAHAPGGSRSNDSNRAVYASQTSQLA